jgi:hypothetical protein
VSQTGSCDIFFPTDFALLQHTYNTLSRQRALFYAPSATPTSGDADQRKQEGATTRALHWHNSNTNTNNDGSSSGEGCGDDNNSNGQVLSSTEFFRQFGNFDRCRTQSGYNPLLVDFVNTQFFVTHTKSI